MTVKAFLRLDIKNISRDGMLLILLPVPMVLAVLLRFVFTPLTELVRPWVHLKTYTPLILMFILNMGPLLTGMISGLLLVDEADDHVIPALAVTPPGKNGFLFYRLASPFILTSLLLLPVPLISRLEIGWHWSRTLPFTLICSLAAPLEAMIIAVFSRNKIEAMAVAKMTGILFMAPFIAWFAPGPWKFAGAPLPGFWVSLAGFGDNSYGVSMLLLVPSILLLLLAARFLLIRFNKRIF